MFFQFDEEMRKIFKTDIDKHNILTWYIYNTNYQDTEYNGLAEGECYSSISVIAKETGINESKVKRLLKALENDQIIQYTYKSKSKHHVSRIRCKYAQKNKQVNKQVDKQVNKQVQSVDITELEVVDKQVNKPVDKQVNKQYSKNKYKNKSKYISIVVNSEQLSLIREKCSITGEIDEQQQIEIQNMNINLLEKAIEKCNTYKPSYNINYLLQAYRNAEQENKVTPIKKSKPTMSEKLGIENLNHTQNYNDLEERLLKLQATKRNI